MPRSLTGSRLALIFRRLRGRFGIAAPRVAVRTQVPWYWRAAGTLGFLALAIALADWAFDTGRRMAGFDQRESSHQVSELRAAKLELEEEVERLRSLLSGSESGLQIERSTQQQLTEKNAALLAENARLKEELAVFERLAKLEGKGEDEVALDRLSLRAVTSGRYSYSFLIALQGARRGKESRFSLQVVVTPRNGSAGSAMTFPRQGEADTAQYQIALRNFRRIEGVIEVPPAYSIGMVEIKVFEAGILKASQSLTL